VPWTPELFSAPALQRLRERYRREHLRSVRFFDGLLSGEVDALVGSFSGPPELHHPVLGRIKGERAFRRYIAQTTAWMATRHVEVENSDLTLTVPRGVEEVLLHLDGDGGRIDVPVAVATDHAPDQRIVELRMYFDTRAMTGRHVPRLPVLQPDPDVPVPAFANGNAIERCTVTDDGRACAVEFNAVNGVPAEPGLAVFVRGDGGALAATRVYG
jgi:hypothetical protein